MSERLKAIRKAAADVRAARKELRSSGRAATDARRAFIHGELTPEQLETATRRHYEAFKRAQILMLAALIFRKALHDGHR